MKPVVPFQWIQTPPEAFFLPDNEVHVWRVSLNAPLLEIQHLAELLSTDERLRAERFRFEQHRTQFTVSRGILRVLLGQYLKLEPRQIQFCYGSHGKPALSEKDSRIQFNLSHSEQVAVFAIALQGRVGIDVEQIRPLSDVEQLSERCFSTREHRAIAALPPNQRQSAFFRYWTCKEAYLKAIGKGLAHALDQVEITLPAEGSARLLNAKDSSAAEWSLWELTPTSGYASALVVEGHDYQLVGWQWSSDGATFGV